MPYIKHEDRLKFSKILNDLQDKVENAGELNYLITKICHQYIKNKGKKYQNYNDIMGALEGVKMELYRKQISPYEDIKIIENGDI